MSGNKIVKKQKHMDTSPNYCVQEFPFMLNTTAYKDKLALSKGVPLLEEIVVKEVQWFSQTIDLSKAFGIN